MGVGGCPRLVRTAGGGYHGFFFGGVLARIADALAVAGVPIFAASTFDTDYVLVRAEALDRAVDALRGAAIQIT